MAHIQSTQPASLTHMLGQYRRFGDCGPTYQIIDLFQPPQSTDWLMHIQLLESGEILTYPYTQAVQDPEVC